MARQLFSGVIGTLEKNMEATLVQWGFIGIMEKKMETTIVYWGYIRNQGKENGSYYSLKVLHVVSTILASGRNLGNAVGPRTHSHIGPLPKKHTCHPAQSSAKIAGQEGASPCIKLLGTGGFQESAASVWGTGWFGKPSKLWVPSEGPYR